MDERPDFYAIISKNKRSTWVLLFVFFLLLCLVGAIVGLVIGGGVVAVVIAIGISGALTFSSYNQSSALALRASRATPASREDYLQLHNVVETVSIAAGIPKPDVYVVHDPAPNAFATGKDPDHAAVAATTGLLAKMKRDELEGVMAHEIAHIRNYDIRVMSVAAATAGSIALIADMFWRLLYFGGLSGGRRRGNRNDGAAAIALVGFIVVAVLAPLAASLLKAAVSRRREALADASAIEITRYPTGLRRALEKLDADTTVIGRTSHATSHLWIESPDDKDDEDRQAARLNAMFNTHPPLKERIDVLRAIEGLGPYEGPEPGVVAELERAREVAYSGQGQSREPQRRRSNGSYVPASATVRLDASPTDADATSHAGWYADPEGPRGALRYWDGDDWTEHVHQPRSSLPPPARR